MLENVVLVESDQLICSEYLFLSLKVFICILICFDEPPVKVLRDSTVILAVWFFFGEKKPYFLITDGVLALLKMDVQ